jgi:hypothetical protein
MSQKNRMAAFQAQIEKMPNGCHLWRGAKTRDGHGQVYFDHGIVTVHRLVWLLARGADIPERLSDAMDGEVPTGPIEFVPLVIRHLWCDNPLCCNVAHLGGGTKGENVYDTVCLHYGGRARREMEAYKGRPYVGHFNKDWGSGMIPGSVLYAAMQAKNLGT